jgi:hypothetical protein
MSTRGYRDRSIRMEVLPEEDERLVVDWITERLRQEALAARKTVTLPDGTERPMNDWEVYQDNIERQLELVELMSVPGGGAYLPAEESDSGEPTILVGHHRNRKKKARTLIHERSHHEMRENVAPNVYGASEVICRGQDNRAVRHRIGQKVEENMVP